MTAPQEHAAYWRGPQLGEAVELLDGKLAVISIPEAMYGDGVVGVCRVADVYGGGFFYGPNVGPPRPGVPEHVSVSGGPHPALPLAELAPTYRTAEVSCWHWKSLPCAGGAVYYRRPVRLWKQLPQGGGQ